MNFQDLHERLRVETNRRIDLGVLTGTSVAQKAGFQQAHISNFLNSRRALSLRGLDSVLAAQNLTVEQIMPVELSASCSPLPPEEAIDAIPIVSPSTAMDEAVVRPESLIETVRVAASQFHDNRAWPSAKIARWQRYVAIRSDAQQNAAMDPVIPAGATVVLDRHYNTLAPYRAHQRSIYAVRTGAGAGAGLVLRYVEFDDRTLILRPFAAGFPIQLIALGARESPAEYIVGRVCLVICEL